MEKLILKSVMYGADKIPDSWFDKVPGGYYKAKEKADDKKAQEKKRSEGSDANKKPRSYSQNHDDRGRGRRDRYDGTDRYDDQKRQERRGRSSYDGSHDEDRRNDRRKARDGGGRQRRHSVDSERHDSKDTYPKTSSQTYYGDRKHHSGRQPRPSDPYFDERQRPTTSESSRGTNSFALNGVAAAGGGFAAAEAVEEGVPYSPNSTQMPSPKFPTAHGVYNKPTPPGRTNNGYVPYGHIYGQPQPSFPPPPTAATPQQGYPQAPFIYQEPVPMSAGVQNGSAPRSAFQPTSASTHDGYEESYPAYQSTASCTERYTDRYSPTYDSSKGHVSGVRRARSEHRPDTSERRKRDRVTDRFYDPQAPLNGQVNVPPPPPGPPPAHKDSRRDSGHERDARHRHRHADRGYTSD